MSGIIMFALIIGVVYIAFTYLKGPRNTDNYRNDFNMRNFNSDTWNEEAPPELPEDDETEMGADGEDLEEIGFDTDEAEAVQESEAPAAELPAAVPAPTTPVVPAAPAPTVPVPATAAPAAPASAAPAAELPEVPQADGVVIDSEVHIDTVMPSDSNI
jgi:hypothetical protein